MDQPLPSQSDLAPGGASAPSAQRNLLLEPVDYKVETTALGVWKRHLNQQGQLYVEFVSHAHLGTLPWIHYTRGICPETGTARCARGVIAVGRRAIGVIAIGQAAYGFIAIGQLSVGILFGLGQLTFGLVAVGQAAFGVAFGLGQLATGSIVIAQLGFGRYVLAQFGLGENVWDIRKADPAARQLFQRWLGL